MRAGTSNAHSKVATEISMDVNEGGRKSWYRRRWRIASTDVEHTNTRRARNNFRVFYIRTFLCLRSKYTRFSSRGARRAKCIPSAFSLYLKCHFQNNLSRASKRWTRKRAEGKSTRARGVEKLSGEVCDASKYWKVSFQFTSALCHGLDFSGRRKLLIL